MSRALITINPHEGTAFLDPAAHVIIHTGMMAVEVHLCRSPVIVITSSDGTVDIEDCDECGGDHRFQLPRMYLDAAERQGIRVDYE